MKARPFEDEDEDKDKDKDKDKARMIAHTAEPGAHGVRCAP
ncbi:hypothetical protein ACIBM4_18515 [Streptomyces sp. NPDC050256]